MLKVYEGTFGGGDVKVQVHLLAGRKFQATVTTGTGVHVNEFYVQDALGFANLPHRISDFVDTVTNLGRIYMGDLSHHAIDGLLIAAEKHLQSMQPVAELKESKPERNLHVAISPDVDCVVDGDPLEDIVKGLGGYVAQLPQGKFAFFSEPNALRKAIACRNVLFNSGYNPDPIVDVKVEGYTGDRMFKISQ